MCRGNSIQYHAARRPRRWEIPVAIRTVRDHGYAVLLAPGNNCMLGRAFFQVIKDLITGDPPRSCYAKGLFNVGLIEVANAPREDLSMVLQVL